MVNLTTLTCPKAPLSLSEALKEATLPPSWFSCTKIASEGSDVKIGLLSFVSSTRINTWDKPAQRMLTIALI